MKRIIFLLILFAIGVTISYFIMTSSKKKLPVINPVNVEEEMVDSTVARVGYGHKIGDFSFINQHGNTITGAEVDGKVYVVEYFFTTCKTICPVMNEQMRRIHERYRDEDGFRILSFTVDPETDTVEQMKRYADDHQAVGDHWHFLTGEKKDLYELARKSFFVLKPAEAQNLGDAGSDFIHTNNFVLVDRKGRIRGYYDGVSADEIDHLIDDIQLLLDEE